MDRLMIRWLTLLGSLAIAALVVGAPTADARQAGADGGFSMEAAVRGEVVTISLVEVSTPVGALELELLDVPALVSDECVLVSGMGACAQTDTGVRIVALNPTGWQEPGVLVELAFVSSPESAELVIVRGTDVNGVDLVSTVVTTVDASTTVSGDSGMPAWVLPVAAIVAVGVLVVVARQMRRTRPASHPE